MLKVVKVDIDTIETDPSIQQRVHGIDLEYVAELAAVLEDPNEDLPPVRLYAQNPMRGPYLLAGGHHTLAAYKQAGRKKIPAECVQGGKTEALLFALSDNATHGKRRSYEDCVKAVQTARSMPGHEHLSGYQIDRLCKVFRGFTARLERRSGQREPSERHQKAAAARLAKRPQAEPASDSVPFEVPTPQGPPTKRDCLGRVLPVALVPAFEAGDAHEAYRAAKTALAKAKSINVPGVQTGLRLAVHALQRRLPYCVCPSCDGACNLKCPTCRGAGYLTYGQYESAVLLILDEAVGIDRVIWEACDSMAMGAEFGMLAFCNPTDTSSEFYQREQSGTWHVVHISCIDHPNIAAELAGLPPPYPSAVRLAWLQDRLRDWANPVDDPLPTDIEFPPGSGRWLRPGPLAESRLLGRWPSAAAGVWSDALWELTERHQDLNYAQGELPEIGADVARFGDDYSEFHVRWGNCSLRHEAYNGLDNGAFIGHLRRLCEWCANYATQSQNTMLPAVRPEEILCKIDSDGMGGRIADHADGYNWVELSAARRPSRPNDYPNVRSELWFNAVDLAKAGQLCVSRLPADVRRELKRQALAPQYKLDGKGRRVVESKEITKRKLGRSPDGLDALNLAYIRRGTDVAEAIDVGVMTSWRDRHD